MIPTGITSLLLLYLFLSDFYLISLLTHFTFLLAALWSLCQAWAKNAIISLLSHVEMLKLTSIHFGQLLPVSYVG